MRKLITLTAVLLALASPAMAGVAAKPVTKTVVAPTHTVQSGITSKGVGLATAGSKAVSVPGVGSSSVSVAGSVVVGTGFASSSTSSSTGSTFKIK